MPAMRHLRTAAAALAALVAGLLAGCGSSHTATVSSSPSSTKTVTRTVTAAHSPQASATASSSSTTSTPTGASSHSQAAAVPICRAAGLKLSYLGGQGATGHGLVGFAVRNTADAACSTIGYPGILFVSKAGAPLPTHPIHTTSDFFGHTKYGQVTVAAGQQASFRLGVTHGSASPKGCVTAAGLQVIAPNDTATMRIKISGGLYECHGTATESPMQPGTSAYH